MPLPPLPALGWPPPCCLTCGGGACTPLTSNEKAEILQIHNDLREAIARGEVKVRLYGRRLRGEWHLVRTQQADNSWLLFKSRDLYSGHSRNSALGIDIGESAMAGDGAGLQPMLAAGERPAFTDPAWVFEVEFDGRRCLAHKSADGAAMLGIDQAPTALTDAIAGLRCEQAVIDGVIVALDQHGNPQPAALEAALAGDTDRLAYYAFDLLQWEQYDLRELPLLDRKAALRTLVPDSPRLLYVDHVAGAGPALLRAIAGRGLRAAIAKRGNSSYATGPSTDWIRIRVEAGEQAAADEPAPMTSSLRFKPANLTKVYWPAEGHTKGDLLAYYQAIADVILPHLRDRPLHLNRYPDGIDGKSFYQREAKAGTPDWVRTVPIRRDDVEVRHHVVDDLQTLLYVVNLGSIDLHPWLSRASSLDEPDHAVLDIDPKSAPFQHVVRIARAAGRLLRGIGIRPLLKTSGKSGLHVFVPLQPGYTYDQSRMFIEAVARLVARELPDIATIERQPGQRDGKVYLDFLQNRRSQTIVPAYSARPVRGASVSTPLLWDELENPDLSPLDFTILTVPDRVAERGDLFRAALEDRHDLMVAITALEEVLRDG